MKFFYGIVTSTSILFATFFAVYYFGLGSLFDVPVFDQSSKLKDHWDRLSARTSIDDWRILLNALVVLVSICVLIPWLGSRWRYKYYYLRPTQRISKPPEAIIQFRRAILLLGAMTLWLVMPLLDIFTEAATLFSTPIPAPEPWPADGWSLAPEVPPPPPEFPTTTLLIAARTALSAIFAYHLSKIRHLISWWALVIIQVMWLLGLLLGIYSFNDLRFTTMPVLFASIMLALGRHLVLFMTKDHKHFYMSNSGDYQTRRPIPSCISYARFVTAAWWLTMICVAPWQDNQPNIQTILFPVLILCSFVALYNDETRGLAAYQAQRLSACMLVLIPAVFVYHVPYNAFPATILCPTSWLVACSLLRNFDEKHQNE